MWVRNDNLNSQLCYMAIRPSLQLRAQPAHAMMPEAVWPCGRSKSSLLGILIMSNHTWACFNCRVALRRPAIFKGPLKCPECGMECDDLGTKIPVPTKADIKGWQQVREHYRNLCASRAAAQIKYKRDRKNYLEQQIKKLERLPENQGRTSLLKQLVTELASLNA